MNAMCWFYSSSFNGRIAPARETEVCDGCYRPAMTLFPEAEKWVCELCLAKGEQWER